MCTTQASKSIVYVFIRLSPTKTAQKKHNIYVQSSRSQMLKGQRHCRTFIRRRHRAHQAFLCYCAPCEILRYVRSFYPPLFFICLSINYSFTTKSWFRNFVRFVSIEKYIVKCVLMLLFFKFRCNII